jgi:hypothetical protein
MRADGSSCLRTLTLGRWCVAVAAGMHKLQTRWCTPRTGRSSSDLSSVQRLIATCLEPLTDRIGCGEIRCLAPVCRCCRDDVLRRGLNAHVHVHVHVLPRFLPHRSTCQFGACRCVSNRPTHRISTPRQCRVAPFCQHTAEMSLAIRNIYRDGKIHSLKMQLAEMRPSGTGVVATEMLI